MVAGEAGLPWLRDNASSTAAALKPMFFSVNTFLWTNAFSERHLPLLERFKSWGADSVEFAGSNFEGFPVAAIRHELDRLDLGCTLLRLAAEHRRERHPRRSGGKARGARLPPRGAVDS